MFKNKTILVTGGTGSFGTNFVKYILSHQKQIKKIIIYSRDELKQFDFSRELSENYSKKKFRFFIGDIRDKSRLMYALKDVDIVVHAAALKQVPAADYNPFEFVKTNILGAQNVIEASLDTNVKNVFALSTDKASSPINLYGATKLCSDKIFTSAQSYAGSSKTKFSVIRYGNVFGSRGSVVPLFLKNKDKKYFEVTHSKMTRFSITLDEAIRFVIECMKKSRGGETFIPKLPSYNIIDLCKAIDPKKNIKIIGVRPGEKLHEEMFSVHECDNILEDKDKYIMLQNSFENTMNNYSQKEVKLKKLKKKFSYSSNTNFNFLNIKQLGNLLNNIK